MGRILSQNGVRLILRDEASDAWYHLDDQATAGKFFGKDVVIIGTYDGLSGTIRIQSIRERTADDAVPAPVEAGPNQQSEPGKSSPAPEVKPNIATPAPQQVNPPQPMDAGVSEPGANIATAPESQSSPQSHVQELAAAAQRGSESLLALPEEAVGASSSVAIISRRSIVLPPDLKSHASRAGNNLVIGKPLARTVPSYPSEAQQQRVEGTVKLHAVIGADGTVQSVEPISGPPSLIAAAVPAVREWRFGPTKINGRPLEAQEDVTLFFRLPN